MSSNSKDARHCTILNTRINVTNMDSAINYLTTELDSLRGKYICVANVHTTVMAYRDSEYRHIQNSAAMVLPDGKPLSYVSRRRGFGDAERVTGPDLMPRIFDISAEDGFRHYFFGGTEETLEKLYERLKESWPQLENAGMFSPPFRAATPSEKEEIIERINAARPDFIWVALGAPKQEQWMYEHRGQFNGVMIGVGAAFDFLSGTTRRAPRIMQELYLEWLFRIFKDPFRLIPRYFDTNFTYVRQAGKETRRLKKENKHKKIAMIGHKRIPSREGGVEIVVDEIATRLVERGYQVDAYNRSGYHVSGKEFDEKRSRFYNGIRLITIPTFRDSKLNAIVYSGLATVRALFGGYGIIHYHAEGPSVMLRVPRFFGIRVVATIHGLDWQRAKWGGFA
jgi:exopolysaccharide biosynthesis WecB/TagA/CpsF family protein